MPPRKAVGPITSLDDIRVSIVSGRSTERSNALKELIDFASRPDRIKPLKDKSIHQLLEAVFHCTVAEKSTYLGGTKTTKAQAENKLALCAQALRTIITQRASKIKVKTARAIVDHVTQVLPGPDHGLVPALQQDYIKALVALVAYPATVEHLCRLGADSWLACLDFCIESLTRLLGAGSQELPVLSRASPAPGPASGTASTAKSGLMSQRHGSHKSSLRLHEDLVLCLFHLVSATNAPLVQRSEQLVGVLVQIFQLRSLNVSNMHQAAFAAVSVILSRVQADDLSLVARTACDLLPLATHWWQPHASKNDRLLNSVRDEILRVIFIIAPHIDSVLQHTAPDRVLSDLEELVDALWVEYSKRDDRARLQLSDLDFSSFSPHYFQTRRFSLRPFDASSEHKWALLVAIVQLECIYSNRAKRDRPSPMIHDAEQPRKRRRIEGSLERLHQKLDSADDSLKLVSLQSLPFMLEIQTPGRQDHNSILAKVVSLTSHKQPLISSWAMVASAAYAADPSSKSQGTALLWSQAWQVAVRCVSHQATSRAASLLLYSILEADILPYHEISDSISTMITAADISGPAVVADSSLALMRHLLHLRNNMLPGASHITCSHTIRWLFSKWNPADVTHAMLYSGLSNPVDIANLLRACCGGRAFQVPHSIIVPGGPIYQHWFQQNEDNSLMSYLLLSHGALLTRPRHTRRVESAPLEESKHVTDAADANAAGKLIAELLKPKLNHCILVAESWTEGKAKISTEKLQSLYHCAISTLLVLPKLEKMNTVLSDDVSTSAGLLTDKVLGIVMAASDTQDFTEMCLRSVASLIPAIRNKDVVQFFRENRPLLSLFPKIIKVLDQKSLQPSSGLLGLDLMDLDDEFESPASQSSSISKISTLPRGENALLFSQEGFYIDTTSKLRLLSLFLEDEGRIGILPTEFVDYLTQLPSEDFLHSTRLLGEVLSSDFVIETCDASSIIETVGSMIGEENAACESVLSACVQLIEFLIPVWGGDQDLSAMVGQLYIFLVDKGLPGNNLSPKAQAHLADLLFALLEKKSDFGASLKHRSCRSSLLSLIKEGCSWLRFTIGAKLPKIFELFFFKVHDDLFIDILDVLPTDPDNPEGIAFRLFLLSEIARQWPTTLRRGIYTIFETSGHVKGSINHAQICISHISQYLRLESPKELFRIFAPQLLYTWLEASNLEEIPHEIFGFANLEELLGQASGEAISLMMMRGQEHQATCLAKTLKTTIANLVQQSFAKAMAYSIAHDICSRKHAGRDGSQVTSESMIKRIVGKEFFYQHINLEFVDVVGILFDIIDQEDAIETKCFSKVPSLKYAADISAKIKGYGHSDVALPPNQQPLFRARHLTQELEHLCGRTQHEFQALWSPALVVSVCRRLFNTIRAALGPLHACSVIRKIRILICLAGDQAIMSYPLQMILHSIRPYVGDSECADDVLGITQYLISAGTKHLSKVPAFLAGYGLSLLASLRLFLESSQSSTTQESQFKATKNSAQKFHKWFTEFLATYDSPRFRDESQRQSFQAITQAAARIGISGTAENETNESNLLLEIFKDGAKKHRLLDQSSRDLALALLCGDFKPPPPISKDVVESDKNAIRHSTMVWESCKGQSLHENYMAWAGRVIGRSFAASGEVQEKLLRESRLVDYKKAAKRELGSEEGILEAIESLTTDRDCAIAGLAEAALRIIVTETTAAQDNSLSLACQSSLSEALYSSSDWSPYSIPLSDSLEAEPVVEPDVFGSHQIESSGWSQSMAAFLAKAVPNYTVLSQLPPLLLKSKGFADHVFPFIVHLVLALQLGRQQLVRRKLSDGLKEWLAIESPAARENIRLLLNTILFLRTQPIPGESSIADRSLWLEVNLPLASAAATRCGMYKVALLFAELAFSDPGHKSSRRSSAARDLNATDSDEILLEIFENIDDPDAYYGLPQTSSLDNVLARLEYEKSGMKSLAFRGAQLDDHIRRRDPSTEKDGQSMVRTLGELGLSGLAHSLLQTQQGLDGQPANISSTFDTARRLEIWNLPVPPSCDDHAVNIYEVYQSMHQAVDLASAQRAVQKGLANTIGYLSRNSLKAVNLRQHLGALAALSEIEEALAIQETEEMLYRKFEERSDWMMSGRFDDVRNILSCRESTLSLLSQKPRFQQPQKLTVARSRTLEVQTLLLSAKIFRYHDATQESLNIATSLNNLIGPCEAMGLKVDAAIKMEVANSFWDQGEMISSIRMLQSVDKDSALKKQTIDMNRADLLSRIGHQVSVARLERSEDIQHKYLQPALKELGGNTEGKAAGKVYHQFAVFCDEQLQNPDSMADLKRVKNLEQGKSEEVEQLGIIVSKTRDPGLRQKYIGMLNKARSWLELDRQELRRIEQTRSEFVRLSLENYLLSLSASDEHNDDALRFTALWLERSEEPGTIAAVQHNLPNVPSRKMAPLINQLTSRLQASDSVFHKLLQQLVFRICCDHPYHGMYQIWSGMKSKINKEDEVAVLRSKAMSQISEALGKHKKVQGIWQAVNYTNAKYYGLAVDRGPSEKGYKQGQKVAIHTHTQGKLLQDALVKFHIPPPTMQMELRVDCDYSNVPVVVKLEPEMSIASGLSAPKILTAVGSDGARYKQLVKGGNDDLRQDAIMEQVFAAVSSLLKLHRNTRQRNLGIRTYKVVPLTTSTGLIEFVSNTIPLHDYLIPAHERYYPKLWKGNQCRKEISNAQNKPIEERIRAYRKVTERFPPVMRYFFMENFPDPDEWFVRRLAYTRTTAAISMLGHVLGLGDRHGHNILLDTRTGEVVHIDLGIAFEMGRIMTVPELVPFRLTRDIVDGMGITKTEGVFRRCCEFTMDALREETYSIMTILDVLRYDPLYSWSISPVRLARLQDTTTRDNETGNTGMDVNAVLGNRKVVNEPSEAERALEVVRKKLSKTLSVAATVNDLINQASAERNLACLFSGWAAYA